MVGVIDNHLKPIADRIRVVYLLIIFPALFVLRGLLSPSDRSAFDQILLREWWRDGPNALLVLVTLALGAVGFFVTRWLSSRQPARGASDSAYSGTWEDEILDDLGDVIKKDRFNITQTGDYLSGEIERIWSKDGEGVGRKYEFYGYVRGSAIIAIFWSMPKTTNSYGCLYVDHVSDNIYDGFYLSKKYLISVRHREHGGPPVRIRLKMIPMPVP